MSRLKWALRARLSEQCNRPTQQDVRSGATRAPGKGDPRGAEHEHQALVDRMRTRMVRVALLSAGLLAVALCGGAGLRPI